MPATSLNEPGIKTEDTLVRRSAPVVMFLLVALLYAVLAWRDGSSWNWGQKQGDYYNLLLDGFLNGHLHLKTEVPRELAEHPNPYDPSKRPPWLGLHDASYYQGKYYLYFGAAPALVTMLPFRLLTGFDLPLRAAILFFVILGYGASLACVAAVWRRYFRSAPVLLFVLCALALGIANHAPVILRRASIWELPISAAYAFSMLALGCIYQALHRPRRHIWWQSCASLSLGLAVASRLSFLYSCGLLLLPTLVWWINRPPGGCSLKRDWLPRVASALGPVATVGLGLAWYNYARFGDVFEFGVRYQLSGINEAVVRHFQTSYFNYNQYLYFWQPADWSIYFPFIDLPAQRPSPAGHLGSEHLYGLFTNSPFALLAFALPLALRGRSRMESMPLKVWCGCAVLMAFAVSATLLLYLAAMSRYLMDIAGATLLAAAVAALAVSTFANATRISWLSRAVTSSIAACSLASVFFGLMYGFEIQGLFKTGAYPDYTRLARFCNFPSHWLNLMTGRQFGPVELQVEFPGGAPARREILLRTDAPRSREMVFVEYDGSDRAKIGYTYAGGGALVSRPFPIRAGQPATVTISLGSLYPPEEHPYFDSHPVALRRRISIFMDGRPLVLAERRTNDARPASVVSGPQAAESSNGHAFSGKWLSQRVLPPAGPEVSAGVSFWVNSGSHDPGQQIPLVASGGASGWRLEMIRVGQKRARMVCRSASGVVWESEIFDAGPGFSHEITLRSLDGMTAVSFNDTIVGTLPPGWGSLKDLRIVGPVDPMEGDVLKSGNATSPAAFGIASLPSANGEGGGDFDTLQVRLRFPETPEASREPLVVTGHTGRGDFLLVEYLSRTRVRFHFDHWGKLPLSSPSVEIDPGQEQVIDLRMGSFPSAKGNLHGPRQLYLSLNGKVIFDRSTAFFSASPSEVFIARNPIGGTSCSPFFSGILHSVNRLRSEAARE